MFAWDDDEKVWTIVEKRERAEWKTDGHDIYECSNCGFEICGDEILEIYHYCPHCGATMENYNGED